MLAELAFSASDLAQMRFSVSPMWEAGTSFRLLGLEVTQTVQSPSNTVPLIAAAANSFKRTFVRVYLGVSGASRVTAVSGTLTASRQDGSAPGGPESMLNASAFAGRSESSAKTVRVKVFSLLTD